MDVTQIEQKLKERLNFDKMVTLAMLTADGTIACKHIIDLCAHQNQQIAFRASWTLEYTASVKIEVLTVCIRNFLKLYPKVTNYSVQRSFTKIMMLLTKERVMSSEGLKAAEFEECLSATFEWLLNLKTPVAVQCNALDVIYQLSPYYDWMLDELLVILQEKLVSSSPALTSRARKLLKKIN